MKILVTGGSGFIGSNLIRKALKNEYTIVNVDSLTYSGSNNNLTDISNNELYFFEHANILDYQKLINIFELHQPDCVLHLAAESHVDRSIDKPDPFIYTNINGTFNLLEASRIYCNKNNCYEKFRFIHISTDEVYGSAKDNVFFSEDSNYYPNSPYSASKASSDHLVRAWFATYNLPTIVTHCSNNYGPFQFPEKLIPVVIYNAISNNSIPVYGNGKNIRDWIYVEDHVEALFKVLKKGKPGRSYNIGANNTLENIEIVKTICSILDKKKPSYQSYSEQINYVLDRPGHDFRYAVNSDLIHREFNWTPKISFEKGINITIDWYLSNYQWLKNNCSKI